VNPLRFVRTIEYRPVRTATSQLPVNSVFTLDTRSAGDTSFADQIFGRYTRGLGLARGIDLIWRRIHLQSVQQTNLNISPSYPIQRLQLRIAPMIHLQHSTLLHPEHVVHLVLPAHQDVVPTPNVGEFPLLREQDSSVTVLPMIQRLLARVIRIDSTVTHPEQRALRRLIDESLMSQTPATSLGSNSVEPPIGDVLRHSLNVRALDSGVQDEQSTSDPSRRMDRLDIDSPVRCLRKSTAPVIDKADLTMLTDRVVQAIDRRLIAQRERLGRW
jgi:hypothetical protein